MFNQTAQTVFDESIERALAVPPGELVASETELSYATGLVSYALFRGDISHDQAHLMHLRIRAARESRVARLCRRNVA
ncbi:MULTISPECIES: hypothetical protein [Pseudomonas]|uniref:hypothetical protein n=1 Tax=Pseudomonas TaxID=286 RepID=UPI001F29C686|nr:MULTISPECIES: hypothetical protein [Pseudomonas]UJW20806.1 hypothetical protein L2Y89_17760 [Pseudomonas juntendi]